MNTYYREKQFLAIVDRNDNIIGKQEKWEAHKKGVLHRGYTAILTYHNDVVLEHRKHPLFNGVFDMTFSSHQLYQSDSLQSDEDALKDGLLREWGVDMKEIVSKPRLIDKIYYEAHDPKSNYIEHEIDYIFLAELKDVPHPNLQFAYGYELVAKKEIKKRIYELTAKPAPWIEEFFKRRAIGELFAI